MLNAEPGKAPRGNPVVIYAAFWQRFAALLVDTLILLAANVVVNVIVKIVLDEMLASAGEFLAASLIGMLYFPLLESSAAQATWGKRMMGLCLVDEEGNRISFSRAMSRHIRKFKSSVIFLAGYWMQPLTEKQQALHDIMTGTFVVKKTFLGK